MRKYATTLILWATLLINELHSLWGRCGLLERFGGNTMYVTGGTITVQWYVWLLSNSLWGILIGLAVMMYRENRINRTSVKAYILFCCIDLLMFFVNFKQHDYESIYTFLLIGWILIYRYGTTDRQGNIGAA